MSAILKRLLSWLTCFNTRQVGTSLRKRLGRHSSRVSPTAEAAGASASSAVTNEVDRAGDGFGCLAADICPAQPESTTVSDSGDSPYVYTPWSDISGTSTGGSREPCNAETFQRLPDGADRHSPSTPTCYVHDVCEKDDDGMSSAAEQCIRCHFLETRAGLTERMHELSAQRPARVPSPYPSHVWDEDSLASSELSFVSSLVAWQSSSPSSRKLTSAHVEGRADVGDASSAQNFVPPWKPGHRGRRSRGRWWRNQVIGVIRRLAFGVCLSNS